MAGHVRRSALLIGLLSVGQLGLLAGGEQRGTAPPPTAPPATAQTSQQTTTDVQAPPQFRTRTTLVPVDVRVLDSAGQPVTDLTQADFTILEDNTRQQIRHFVAQSFTAMQPDPKSKVVLRNAPAAQLTPQTNRIFLLLLGRGRLQPPAKGVDAALQFVREMLLPQDQVAVLAFNRATDFTTDHEQIAQVLERFKKKHEDIEGKLVSLLGGLAGVYGSLDIPEKLQKDIDAIFETPGGPKARQLAPGQIANSSRVGGDNRAAADQLLGAGGSPTIGGTAVTNMDLTFDEFVDANSTSMQDLSKLYTGIDYLRYIEGEKHLVFITESGMALPRVEDDNGLAATANNARVVIDTILTGGVMPGTGRGMRGMPDPIPTGGGGRGVADVGPATARAGRAGGRAAGGPVSNAPAPSEGPRRANLDPFASPGAMFSQGFRIQSLGNIARMTGGQSSFADYASKTFQRINTATSFSYQLGYYPTNSSSDGRYRKILVRVNRPGMTVLYRHGYTADENLAPFDRQQTLTYSRIVAAAGYTKDIPDIKLTVTPIIEDDGGPWGRLAASITLDPSTVAFANENGLRTGAITLALFVGDASQNPVGEAAWQKMDLKLGAEAYERLVKDGVKHTMKIDLRGRPMYVKVVAYDFANDKVGSAMFKFPAPR